MSLAKAREHVLSAIGDGTTALVSAHLALPSRPLWCDGLDAEGRPVLLIGAHALRALEGGGGAVSTVLAMLGDGAVPEGVHPAAMAPEMASASAEILAGPADEVLVDGERGTGKTFGVALTLPMLAELHARAGFPLPLIVLWVHDSLASASAKTVPSLTEALWGGHWRISDGGRLAEFVLAGTVYVEAHFVGATDQQSAERLKAACHVVVVEEAVASLTESGGVDVRSYEVARSSQRLPSRRKVAVVVTNPGDPSHWCFQRFMSPGSATAVRCRVSAADRLTEADIAALDAAFRDSPDLHARLAKGEWAALLLGECVAVGYRPEIHVSPTPLRPSPNHVLALGFDGGHSPSCVVGQLIGGQVRLYAALNDLKSGMQELLDDQVVAWLETWAPWTRDRGGYRLLQAIIDPSMKTTSEATVKVSAERVISETLRGRMAYGAQFWPPRREAILRGPLPAARGRRGAAGDQPRTLDGDPPGGL